MSERLHNERLHNERLYFLHIAKTAGTSIADWIIAHYPAPCESVMPCHVWQHLLQATSFTLSQYRFFHGHFGYALVPQLPPDTQTFTFLRHPVERTISHYYHLLADAQSGHAASHWIALERVTDDFLQTLRDNAAFFSNYQTRSIYHALDVRQRAAGQASPYRYSSDSIVLQQPEGMLDSAIARLQNEFAFVGVVEDMEYSLDAMARRFGLDKSVYRPANINAERPRPEAIPVVITEAILELNELDIALWEAGRKILKKTNV